MNDRTKALRLRELEAYRNNTFYVERAVAIKAAHHAGATITEIADRLGVARQIVYDALRGGREA